MEFIMVIENIDKQLSRCRILSDKISSTDSSMQFHAQNLNSLKQKWRELALQKARSKDQNEKETLSFHLSENRRQQESEQNRLLFQQNELRQLENDYDFNECGRVFGRF